MRAVIVMAIDASPTLDLSRRLLDRALNPASRTPRHSKVRASSRAAYWTLVLWALAPTGPLWSVGTEAERAPGRRCAAVPGPGIANKCLTPAAAWGLDQDSGAGPVPEQSGETLALGADAPLDDLTVRGEDVNLTFPGKRCRPRRWRRGASFSPSGRRARFAAMPSSGA
jgi:hypothetical protein